VQIQPAERTLDLVALGEPPGFPALTPAMGATYAEAAGVCFHHGGHDPGVVMDVRGVEECQLPVRWPPVTEQMLRSRNDLQDATRDGAYAVAIGLALELTGLKVVLQAKKGPDSGFDYWLGESEDSLFQGASRLEVSGILKDDGYEVKRRLNEKKRQVGKSDHTGLPAFVCVVEFGQPQSHFVKK